MYLSRLVLKGFKSYSEPVEVDFSPTISVIIGSNGVGKSNALEGILWALGEDDLRALRCRNRTDLIFSGSQSTPPAEEARVEVTFDENGSEHSFSRSILRSGAESFTIDGSTVENAVEYQEKLVSLGIGAGRDSVIRQEELTDFFAKTPDQRKSYLERYISSHGELQQVNKLFDTYLKALIDGGAAAIVNAECSGDLDVEVVFPDKGAKWGTLLSGGERAVTALALKLALFHRLKTPMFILDEVEPSLDWTRNRNMQNLLKNVSTNRQLIMVTHFQSTIQMAKTVHGVRIRLDGSSWLKFHFLMDERLFKVYKCC